MRALAGANSREAKYRAWLEAAGVWQDGYQAAIHDLCILERRRSDAMKEWAETAPKDSLGKRIKRPSVLDPLHEEVSKLDKMIYEQRKGLGLTAEGLRKLKPPEEKLDTTMEIRVVLGGAEKWAQ